MLSDMEVRRAGPREKAYKLADKGGLYLLVKPNGSRLWRFDYRFARKRQTASLGEYPAVGLGEARRKHAALREQIESGINPMDVRRRSRLVPETEGTFGAVFAEWFGRMAPVWSESHARGIKGRFQANLLPDMSHLQMSEIDAPVLLAVLRKIEARGSLYQAKRARENVGTLFRYAIQTGRCRHDPSQDLRGAFVGHVEQHRPALVEPAAVAEMLRAVWEYSGGFVTRQALRLAVLTALRPGEVRRLEWTEVDFEAAEIRIPAAKMKMRAPHIVPLSRQALAVLEELREVTGRGQYAFPSARNPRGDRPMSDACLSAALNRMGFKDIQSAHGFRSVFCSLLNETGRFNHDAIERQLAHAERNSVRAAYLHTQFLQERQRMMTFWGDYVDELRTGQRQRAKVVKLRG